MTGRLREESLADYAARLLDWAATNAKQRDVALADAAAARQAEHHWTGTVLALQTAERERDNAYRHGQDMAAEVVRLTGELGTALALLREFYNDPTLPGDLNTRIREFLAARPPGGDAMNDNDYPEETILLEERLADALAVLRRALEIVEERRAEVRDDYGDECQSLAHYDDIIADARDVLD